MSVDVATNIRSERSGRPLVEFADLTDVRTVRHALDRAGVSADLFGAELATVRLSSITFRTYEEQRRRYKSSALVSCSVEAADGRCVALYLRAYLDPRRVPSLGDVDHTWHVPDLRAVAWTVHGDPALPALGPLLGPSAVGRRTFAGWHIESPPTVLRYKPGDRATLLVEVSDGETRDRVVAKVFASSGRTRRLNSLAKQLWRRATDVPVLVVPQPLHVGSDETLWLSHLRGVVPRRQDLSSETVGNIASALAAFHSFEPVSNMVRSTQHQLDETATKAHTLACHMPSVQSLLLDTVSKLAEDRSSLPRSSSATVHGAFRLRQLLLHDGRIGLLDFDSVATGDPVEDVADFVLDLGWADGAAPLVIPFIAGYEDASGAAVDRDRLRWHLGVQQVKRAYWLRTRVRSSESEIRRRVERAASARDRVIDGLDR